MQQILITNRAHNFHWVIKTDAKRSYIEEEFKKYCAFSELPLILEFVKIIRKKFKCEIDYLPEVII